jgi:hypothetical protein
MLAALSIKAQPRAAKHDDKRAGHARGPSHLNLYLDSGANLLPVHKFPKAGRLW